ncbi:DNA-binding protein [Pseudomonas sp. DTU12.1]|uniref:DNA-binding protein n=1 Tax=Pseudomonas sp. DTU12.1 TaxID=2654238 RepID=UPI00132EA48C|nr:DNA-binding protein [Pseudomonas sp. DTU12.1]QHG23881.1 integrase [Pseudomonas sp. DTU12.1]
MARGGINKAVVQKARQSLLARGTYPSIDAVRVELGNTGSKTTIARYLKEIESYDPRPLSSRERMGEELSAMVESLLDRLMEEGNESIEQSRSAFDIERVELQAQIDSLQTELTAARRQLDTQQAAIEAQTADLKTTQSSLQAELTRNAGLNQRCTDLEALVSDRDKQIHSLEEKHVHARGALEHYRESVKEQREQDQRRHESQLHETQMEKRKLQETLVLKQDELTRLNRDNERLLGESRQQVKLLHGHEAHTQTLTGEIQGLKLAEARSAGVAEQLQEQIATLRQDATALNEAAAKSGERELEARLLLVAAQSENERLRRLQATEAETDGSDSNTTFAPASEKPKTAPTKPSRK